MFEGWAAAAAVVGAGVVGSAISASGAESAAQTQANAANNAQQISLQEFNTITGQEQPFMNAGYSALGALDYGLGVGPESAPAVSTPSNGNDPQTGYQLNPWGGIGQLIPGGGVGALGGSGVPISGTGSSTTPVGPQGTGLGYGSLLSPFTADMMKQYSPAYQFQLQQGQQGVLNAETGSMGALSGAASKDLINYNQNLANTAFSNAFNQYQTQQGNIYQRLAGVAQLGQASAANTGQQGTALAGQAAQSATNVGTALAGGQVGVANAISGGLSNSIPWLAYGGGGSNFTLDSSISGDNGQALLNAAGGG